MAELQWGILQSPNFADTAQRGVLAGMKVGEERRRRGALEAVDLNRPETIAPVLRYDVPAGVALLKTSREVSEARREEDGRQAYGDAVATRLGVLNRGALGGSGTVAAGALSGTLTSGQPATGVLGRGMALRSDAPATLADLTGVSTRNTPVADTPAGNAMPAADPGEIVVNGRPQPAAPPVADLASQAASRLAHLDPGLYDNFVTTVGRMDDAERKRLDSRHQAMAMAALQVQGLPFDQRRAAMDELAPELAEHGVTPEELDGFDPSDNALLGVINEALGVKGVIQKAQREQALAESRRHNQAGEAVSAGRLAVSREGMQRTDTRGRRGQDMASTDRRRGQDMADKRARDGVGGGKRAVAPAPVAGPGARSPASPSPTPPAAGRIIVNPQTGQRMQLHGKQWVAVK